MHEMSIGLFVSVCLFSSGCGLDPFPALVEPDPVASALFRQSTDWRGADGAYSVGLGNDRFLWLFGDSWVGEGAIENRTGRTLTRSTVALQTGQDFETANIEFFGDPFFDDGDDDDSTWLWPGPAVLVEGRLLMFLLEEHAVPDGFGFEATGTRVVWTDEVDRAPSEWTLRQTTAPPRPVGVEVGGVYLESPYLYLFAVEEPGNHDVYLGRIHVDAASEGDLSGALWFNGTNFGDPASAEVIVDGDQTEFSVHRQPDGELWMISTDGFGDADIVVRTASRPEGPWSDPRLLFHPPLGDSAGVFIYSAKAHPEFGLPLRLTYCSNHEDFFTMASRLDLYFPHVLTLREFAP